MHIYKGKGTKIPDIRDENSSEELSGYTTADKIRNTTVWIELNSRRDFGKNTCPQWMRTANRECQGRHTEGHW